MRIGIVICSSADLPRSFIDEHDLNIMPIALNFGGEKYVDVRDPHDTQEFYKKYLQNKDVYGVTEPYTVEQISDWFLDELVLKYDRILVLSINSTRSPIFANATKASFAILRGYREKRRAAGIKGSFSLRVVDTKNLFAGEGVLAYEAIRLLKKENLTFDKLRPRIEALTNNTYGYLVPNDLYYLRNVARKKGDRSLGMIQYAAAKALDIKPIMCCHKGETFAFAKVKTFDGAVAKLFETAKEAISNGLGVNMIPMSYAGNPEEFTKRADYKEFVNFLDTKKVKHIMSVMSTTAGVNIGPGSFALGYATNGTPED